MGEKKGKKRVTEREGDKVQETLKYREQTEGGWGLGERGKWVMGIEEGTYWDEHWVLHVSLGESTPKTKSTLYALYVSQFDNKLYLKK